MRFNRPLTLHPLAAAMLIAGVLTSALAQADETAPAAPTPMAKLPEAPKLVLTGNKELFNEATSAAMPLTPAQIEQLRAQLNATQTALHDGPPPELRTPRILASFAPGATVQVIHVVQGYPTTLSFLDNSGHPWAISSVAYNKAWFTVDQPAATQKTAPENVLTISALTVSASSTLPVLLKGAPAPVILLLQTGSTVADVSASVVMNARAPTSPSDVIETPPVSAVADETMMLFLSNTPPVGAIALVTHQSGLQAWQFKDATYVRTQDYLLSPAWTGSGSSPDGMHVYQTENTATVLLQQRDGHTAMINLDKAADHE